MNVDEVLSLVNAIEMGSEDARKRAAKLVEANKLTKGQTLLLKRVLQGLPREVKAKATEEEVKRSREFAEQLHNPQHFFLKLGNSFMTHNFKDKEDPSNQHLLHLHGKKIRFTKQAGERMLKWAKSIGYKNAQLIPEKEVS